MSKGTRTNSASTSGYLKDSEKLILGCTAAVLLTAYWMHQEKYKYDRDVRQIKRQMHDIRNLVIISNQFIQEGNAELQEGNQMLYQLVDQTVEGGHHE